MTLDYEIYGVIESRCPNHAVKHAWGLIAQIRARGHPLQHQDHQSHTLTDLFLDPPLIYNGF